MKFRVIRGIHTQDGVVYEAGTDHNIVETDIDLIKSFNNNGKFERVTRPVDEVEQVQSTVLLKNEVTDDFNGANEMGLEVYHENRQYFVISKDTGQPVHKTKVTSKEAVLEMIKGMK